MVITYLYTLSDRDGNIRYVGKSNKPTERLRKHINESKKLRTHKEKWINSLINDGVKPKLDIIDEVNVSEWSFWEEYWIGLFRSWGFTLTNGTSGGEGSDGFKGKKHSDETKSVCRDAAYSRKSKTRLNGEDNGRAKLSNQDIIDIKYKVSLDIPRKIIAEEYSINPKYIYQILSGKRRSVK